MYHIEKIGELILITLEGDVKDEEIHFVKDQLKKMAAADDDVVVSLNLANPDGSKKSQDAQAKYQEIIDYCIDSNIRIYSYASE